MTYHIIITFVPKDDIYTESKRLYQSLHQPVNSPRDISFMLATMADTCEDANESGYETLRVETFTSFDEYREAWGTLASKETFKTLY